MAAVRTTLSEARNRCRDAYAVAAAGDGQMRVGQSFFYRAHAAVLHLGFSLDIIERHRSGTIYWIDLDLGASAAAEPT